MSLLNLLTSSDPELFSGGGELGARMRALDWAANPLGPPQHWPQSLKTCVRIVLTSRQPMFVWWGDQLINLYNDAYTSIIGSKHPAGLGRPAAEVWHEIWDQVGPRAETAMRRNEGTYDESLLLLMQRHGYREETYYTFSYSPVPNDQGGTGGILCANTEDTLRILGARQLALLGELAAGATSARSVADAARQMAAAMASNPRDLPFALIYLPMPGEAGLSLAGWSGIAPGHVAAPARLVAGDAALWNAAAAPPHGLLRDLTFLAAELPCGAWDEPPRQAVLLPIHPPQGEAAGLLVAGLNPYRLYDAEYEGFMKLVAGQLAAGIGNAQAYESERRRAEALAELDRAKTLFFSNISHEFRTPLTLMLAPLEDALGDAAAPLPAAQRTRLEVAHRNSLRLLRLVNTLLDFSRIEAGRAQARYQPTDLAAFTADLAASFRAAVERAGMFLRVDCAPGLPPVHVDRAMWEKIVLNLLSNAFKFCFSGGIAVRLRRDAAAVVLEVQDTGVGIPAAELPRVFERFHRIEGQQGRSFEGSGIGLSLVHELVRLHGGEISVASRVGEGSTFSVRLPIGQAHLPAEHIVADDTPAATPRGGIAFLEEALRWLPEVADGGTEGTDAPAGRPHVLLADDNADMRDYVRRLLGPRYAVTTAPDGAAALAALRRHRPDLVISDVMMPGLDGFGLLRAIRDDPALRDLPVILLSARAGEEARSEGLEAGADDYLTKPFAARELLARIGANLDLARLRRQAAQEQLDSAERLRRMFEQAPGFMCVLRGPDYVYELANAAYHRLVGGRPLVGLTIAQALPELHGQGFLTLLDTVYREGTPFVGQGVRVLLGPERAEYFLDFVYQPVRDASGAVSGIFVEGADVTERVRAETALRAANEQLENRVAARTAELRRALEALREEMAERARAEEALRQAQKMEAIGQLTGGIAHDFNNLLTGIAGSLELMQTRLVQGRTKDLPRHIGNARDSVTRASALTHRLLAFARRQSLDSRPTDVNALVAGLADLIRRTVGPAITLATDLAPEPWPVQCDTNQLESALLNLCINARDAMPDGGELLIETANMALDDAAAARLRDIAAGEFVRLAVRDTGCGMTPDVLARAFDPFFTTKPIGQGTGLGLSMLYGFVRQSDGHVRIDSAPGQGTRIEIYLPRARGEMPPDEHAAAMAPRRGAPRALAGETVLVVEDEDVIRELVLEVLADLGYRAIAARDAQAALEVLRGRAPIDLLATDVGLPGMNGRQLADAARELRPGLRVLFMTGYAYNASMGEGALPPGMQMIGKPFTTEALATRIRGLMPPAPARAGANEA